MVFATSMLREVTQVSLTTQCDKVNINLSYSFSQPYVVRLLNCEAAAKLKISCLLPVFRRLNRKNVSPVLKEGTFEN